MVSIKNPFNQKGDLFFGIMNALSFSLFVIILVVFLSYDLFVDFGTRKIYLIITTYSLLLLSYLVLLIFCPAKLRELYKKSLILVPLIIVIFMTEGLLWIFYPMPDPFVPYQTPNLKINFSSDGKIMPGIPQRTTFTTDEMGFRTRAKINYREGGDAVRIFFIGGSTTELFYVDDKDTFPYLLEEKLESYFDKNNLEFEIINTGRSGLRSLENFNQAAEFLKYKPDYFVFLTGTNDMTTHLRRLLGCLEINEKYLRAGQDKKTLKYLFTRSQIVRIIYRTKSIYEGMKSGEVFDTAGKRYEEVRNQRKLASLAGMTDGMKKVPEYYFENIKAIGFLTRQNKIKSVFLTQPAIYSDNMPAELDDLLWMTPGKCNFKLSPGELAVLLDQFNDVLRKEAQMNEYVDIVDLSSLLPKDTTVFYDDYHFNNSGSAKIADILFDYFKEEIENTYVRRD